MFENIRKRRAIRQYRNKLGTHLTGRYGIQTSYAPKQVHEGIDELGLSTAMAAYALALYCSNTDFAQDTFFGSHYDYTELNTELATSASSDSWLDIFDGLGDAFDGDGGDSGGGDGGGD